MKIKLLTHVILLSLYIATQEFLRFATRSANTLVKKWRLKCRIVCVL